MALFKFSKLNNRLFLGLVCTLISVEVFADQWLEDRNQEEGLGFRVGNFEIHPGLKLQYGWDSNVFYSDSNVDDGSIIKITPSVFLKTVQGKRLDGDSGGRVLDFNAGLSASYFGYFHSALQQKHHVGVNANADATIYPDKPFSFRIFDVYSRSVRPFAEGADINFARNKNTLSSIFVYSSPSRILEASLGYSFNIDLFEAENLNPLNNFIHRVSTNLRWNFLPLTALYYEGVFEYQQYTASQSERDAVGTVLSNNQKASFRLGINGAFTPKVSLFAMAGYSVGFVDSSLLEDTEGVIGNVELRWRPTSLWNLTIGYDRGFTQSFFGAWYTRDRGYFNGEFSLGGYLRFFTEFWAGYVDYARVSDPTGQAVSTDGSFDRKDILLSGLFSVEYRLTDWMAFDASFQYTENMTDFEQIQGGTNIPEPAKYQKFQVWVGARVTY